MQRALGIDLGSAFIRAATGASQVGGPVRRELPAVLYRSDEGSWEVGLNAQVAAVQDPRAALTRWRELFGGDGPLAEEETRLTTILSATRAAMEQSRGDERASFMSSVLAVPSVWMQTRFSSLKNAAVAARLGVDRVLARSDAATLRVASLLHGEVVTVTLDSEGIEAAVFDARPGDLRCLARRRSDKCTLDSLDDLLISLVLPRVTPTERAEMRVILPRGRSQLLRGESVLLPDAEGFSPEGHRLRLPSAKRTPVAEFVTEIAATLAAEVIDEAGMRAELMQGIVLVDLFAEVDEMGTLLRKHFQRPLVRADEFAVAEGGALFSAGLWQEGPRWLVRDSLGPSGKRSGPMLSLHAVDPPEPSLVHVQAWASSQRPVETIQWPEPARERPVLTLIPQRTLEPVSAPAMAPSATVTFTRLAPVGLFEGLVKAADLAALPSLRRPTEPTVPWPLPLLLMRVERARDARATLVLRTHGRKVIYLSLANGEPVVDEAERAAVRDMFLWPSGTWELRVETEPQPPYAATSVWSMFGLLVEGAHAVLRASPLGDRRAVVAEKVAECPRVIESRQWIVPIIGLSAFEQRLIEKEFDGKHTLASLLHGAEGEDGEVLHRLLLLMTFDAVEWVA